MALALALHAGAAAASCHGLIRAADRREAPVAGVEQGKLKHVPSTSDLLGAAMPQAIAAEARRAASDLGTALQVSTRVRV